MKKTKRELLVLAAATTVALSMGVTVQAKGDEKVLNFGCQMYTDGCVNSANDENGGWNTQDTEEIETGSDIKITLVPGYPKDHLDEKLAAPLNTGEYNVILSVVSASDFIKVIDAYEEENSTDVLLGSIDCFTEDTYEMFNKKGYNGKERIDYLVGKYGAIVAPSFVAMKNALEGFAEDYREDGSAFRLQQSFWTADSVDEFNKQYALSIGMYDNTYSVEDMMGVLKSYTPETNFEEFQKFTEK